MSANERGLGRGLDALFRNVTPAERPSSAKVDSAEVPAPSVPKNTTTLPIAALTPCKGQPRKHFDEAALDELAASIRSQGVIQPLLVRPRRTGKPWRRRSGFWRRSLFPPGTRFRFACLPFCYF